MYSLSMQEKVTVVTALTEKNSIRSIERMTGIHRDTIMRLFVSTGNSCALLMDKTMRELPCRRVQCDEIWTYVGKKAKHVKHGDSPEFGDQWVYVALDAETKLIPAFLVGKRSSENTQAFKLGHYPGPDYWTFGGFSSRLRVGKSSSPMSHEL